MTCTTPDTQRELYGPALLPVLETNAQSQLLQMFDESDAEDLSERASHADIQQYLPDDVLVKMDIASMAHGMEVRSPLLDHELVEFAASLPVEWKLRGNVQSTAARSVSRGFALGDR